MLQLELITELLGTPSLEDMRYACDGARSHMLRRPHKPPSLSALYMLSSQATHEAVHLLCQMLVFDPVSLSLRTLAAAAQGSGGKSVVMQPYQTFENHIKGPFFVVAPGQEDHGNRRAGAPLPG